MLLEGSGSFTPSLIGTEYTLLDLTTSKTFVAYADLSNLAAGDTVVLTVYTKIISTSALLVAYQQSFSGAQANNGAQIQVSLPLPSDQEWKFTLNQSAGTARAFPWKVISL